MSGDKRKNEMGHGTGNAKKIKFNIWGKQEEVVKKLSELVIGKCKNEVTKFRVSFKSEKRNISTGAMFTFHAFDGSYEMQVTAFSPECDKFFDEIQFNKIYQLENFKVRKQPQEFAFNNCQLQIILQSNSNIFETSDPIPDLQFNFVSIDRLELLEKDSKCDFLGILCKDWGIETTANDKTKRDLSFTDKSKKTIIVTLWGKRAETFEESENETFAIRNGVVSEFQEVKSINIFSKSLMWANPILPEATELKKWYLLEIQSL